MREVDQLNNSVNHGVAEGDQGIDRTERHGVHKLVDPEHAQSQRQEGKNAEREAHVSKETPCSAARHAGSGHIPPYWQPRQAAILFGR
jgi:hypothetical protein